MNLFEIPKKLRWITPTLPWILQQKPPESVSGGLRYILNILYQWPIGKR